MNTGVQRSGSTPVGAWTSTTPTGKPREHPKKDIMEILAAHRVPYAATATIAYPEDLSRKLRTAKETKGFRFLLILSPCPTGWRCESKDAVRVSRLAVTSGLFPLYEVMGGTEWVLNEEPAFEGLDEYLDLQGRFSTLTEEQRVEMGRQVRRRWDELRSRASFD
jgi:pyruvate/2-oxoacid:ferredoxin oxidoreductase beta subunit